MQTNFRGQWIKAARTSGYRQVPLDYANPNKGSATLALARLQSRSPNRKGTILTNPGRCLISILSLGDSQSLLQGGPGGSGVDFLIGRAGDLISNVTDGEFDILSALIIK
ncbi:hypothetical protein Clacol_004548 [Clathrus columnatus]|uniref:Uncharacterized protein n=1 Tax=Clathrus columnatus TaxID=1419009 RepID=A0AAV5A6T5_9AGAM|nr:hypothetical protein Clacol_004548 [Clathrus columnatus]